MHWAGKAQPFRTAEGQSPIERREWFPIWTALGLPRHIFLNCIPRRVRRLPALLCYTRQRVRSMNSPTDVVIRDIVRRIVDAVQPDKVILFGSQARGDARPNSDFDILVIKRSDEPRYRRSVPLYVALADLQVEVEVMVYTPEEVDEWSQVPQAFVTTAVREGATIYERRG